MQYSTSLTYPSYVNGEAIDHPRLVLFLKKKNPKRMNNNCKNPRRMNLASLLFVSEKHDFVSRKNIYSPRPSPAICVRCLYTRTTLHPTYSSRASLEGSTCRARNRLRNKIWRTPSCIHTIFTTWRIEFILYSHLPL